MKAFGCINNSTSKMTRNRVNRNPKLTREQLIEINKHHIIQGNLLLNHMFAAQENIKALEEENLKLKEMEMEATNKLKEMEEKAKKNLNELLEAKKKLEESKDLKVVHEKNRLTLLLADSHRKTMNFRQIEEELGGELVVVPAYNSGEWPRAKFPTKSQKVVAPLMLKERPYTDLILQLSCNDISNVDHILDAKLKLHMAEKSCQNTVNIAIAALKENVQLQNVLILPLTPRVDSEDLKLLSDHANAAVIEAVAKSEFRQKIKLGSMRTMLTKTQDQIHQVFGSRFSPRYDGLHCRGNRGQEIYTRAIIDSIRSNGLNLV